MSDSQQFYWSESTNKPVAKKSVVFSDVMSKLNLVVDTNGTLRNIIPRNTAYDDNEINTQTQTQGIIQYDNYENYDNNNNYNNNYNQQTWTLADIAEYNRNLLQDRIRRHNEILRGQQMKSRKMFNTVHNNNNNNNFKRMNI